MHVRSLAGLLVAIALALTPAVGEARKKTKGMSSRGHAPRSSRKHKVARGPRGVHTETSLFDAMAQVNRTSEALEQTIIDVLSAGEDAHKIRQIADTYDALAQAQAEEARTLAEVLTKAEKKQLDHYAHVKLQPLARKWSQILVKVDNAVAQEVAELQKTLRFQMEDLLAECDGLIAQTRTAGGDSARRPALLQRLTRLQANTHALYHDAAKVPGAANAKALKREFDGRLDIAVRRADWLLRTAALPPCPEFSAQVQALHKQVRELEGLSGDFAVVATRAGWQDLATQRAKLIAGLDLGAEAVLTPDELVELRALRDELMGPVDAKLDEAQAEAQARLGAGARRR